MVCVQKAPELLWHRILILASDDLLDSTGAVFGQFLSLEVPLLLLPYCTRPLTLFGPMRLAPGHPFQRQIFRLTLHRINHCDMVSGSLREILSRVL